MAWNNAEFCRLCYVLGKQIKQDAALDGVYLLVAGGATAQWEDAAVLAEWKGRSKVEHCFRLTNQLFLVGPMFLKTPQRIASLVFLIMVGCLIAGLLERQVRRVLATQQTPIQGLMPEGRDTLRPTIPRLLRAFADYSVVYVYQPEGALVARRFAQLTPVQAQILAILDIPSPAAVFG